MSNLKVTLKKALEPGRSERESSELMTVISSTYQKGIYQYRLSGNKKIITRNSADIYAVGDQLMVSDGLIVGRSQNSEHIFWI